MDSNGYLPILLVVLLLLLAMGYVRLFRHYRKNIRKVSFLFNAIDNVDFSFRFPEVGVSKDDQLLNASLNRIKLILQHARNEQMERERYYEHIINATDTGILVVDSHDNVLQHNQATLSLLHTEVLTHLNQVRSQLKDEHLSMHETHVLLRDKPVRIIALSDVSNELSNQEVDSWVKLIRVLTHEIMNTVTPIISLSETLLQRTEASTDEDLRTGLDTIGKTSRELLAFVNDYRRFTHMPQPHPTLFYVEPFLQRMKTLCAHEVVIDVMPKDLLAYADEGLMSHVVTNLLKNAIEAHAQHIYMKAYANKQEAVVIEVCNDGDPIPEEIASHIFVPFFTTKSEGSGIGLPLSRQMMRVSGGTLSLRQDKEQGMVMFVIVLG